VDAAIKQIINFTSQLITMTRSSCPAKRQRITIRGTLEKADSIPVNRSPWASINVPWPPPTMQSPCPPLCPVPLARMDVRPPQAIEAPMAALVCKVCWGALDLGEDSTHTRPAASEPTHVTTCTQPIALSCGHVFCATCTRQLQACPICRSTIVGKQRLFFP
jgi:hypothetical protein